MARPAEERPTGFCCTGDDIAGLVMSALARLGRRVPEDVSVVGFNDDPTAARQLPPLTTVRQPYHDLAARALDLIAEQMNDIACRGQRVVLPAPLVVRASSGPPAMGDEK